MASSKSRKKTAEQRHPLESDLGTTTVQDAVVTSIAGMAVNEVAGTGPETGGTRIPGDNSRTVGEFFDSITSGAGRTRGISVEVGEKQAAVDLTLSVDYGKPIPGIADAVRQSVIQRVENLTGLEVTEVNISIEDISFDTQGNGSQT